MVCVSGDVDSGLFFLIQPGIHEAGTQGLYKCALSLSIQIITRASRL